MPVTRGHHLLSGFWGTEVLEVNLKELATKEDLHQQKKGGGKVVFRFINYLYPEWHLLKNNFQLIQYITIIVDLI